MSKFFLLLALVTQLPLLAVTKSVGGDVVAEVNGVPIYQKEVLRMLRRSEASNPERQKQALEQLILYKLAVEQAVKEGIPKRAEVKKQIDRILYKSYLNSALERTNENLDPSQEEIKKSYDQRPLVRLRHLVLMAGNSKERETAKQFSAIIQRNIEKKSSFRALVLRYSQDESAAQAGDIDFRGFNNLPKPLYLAALKLKKGEIAGPIEFGSGVHYIELLDVKPYKTAFAPYKALLKAELKSKKEIAFLSKQLNSLLKTSDIKRKLVGMRNQ